MKNVECPKCIGMGELYTPVVEVTKCDLCKGKGFVTEATADGYDPFEIIEEDDY